MSNHRVRRFKPIVSLSHLYSEGLHASPTQIQSKNERDARRVHIKIPPPPLIQCLRTISPFSPRGLPWLPLSRIFRNTTAGPDGESGVDPLRTSYTDRRPRCVTIRSHCKPAYFNSIMRRRRPDTVLQFHRCTQCESSQTLSSKSRLMVPF